MDQNIGNSQRDVDAARAFIDGQITEYEAKLSAAERKVAQFRREHAAELIGAERYEVAPDPECDSCRTWSYLR